MVKGSAPSRPTKGRSVATKAEARGGTSSSRPRNRKELILQAATELFVREGYHRTSMGDIAATLGITSTALYRHYRNKQQLLARSLLEGLDLVMDVIESATAADPEHRLETLLHSLAALAIEQRGRAALWQREMRHLAREDRWAVAEKLATGDAQIRSIIEQSRPGLSTDDAELLAWCVAAVFESISYHRIPLSQERLLGLLKEISYRVTRAELTTDLGAAADVQLDDVHRVGLHDLTDHMSRRERLIASATRLFDRRGYAAVGIEDIGAAAGITGPSVYYHFTSKAELLTEIIERGAQAVEYYTTKALAEGKTPTASLERLIRYYALYAHAQPDLVGVIVGETIHLPADAAARYRDIQRDGIKRWMSAVRAVRPELDDASARVTVQAFIMAVNDAVRLPHLAQRPALDDEMFSIGRTLLLST